MTHDSPRRALAISHLVQSVSCARGNSQRWIGMLRCYLDDSGTDKQSSPTVTMAGYVAELSAWENFEKKSRAVFRRAKLDRALFHAKEFHDGDAPFNGWSTVRQVQFINEWFDVAATAPIALGITVSMPQKRYDQHRRLHGVKRNTSAFGHCFDELVNHILSDDQVGDRILKGGISFFVEAGVKANDGVLSIFNKRRAGGELHLREMAFIGKDTCRAIQLADCLAFYSRRHATSYETGKSRRMPSTLTIAKEKIRTIGEVCT